MIGFGIIGGGMISKFHAEAIMAIPNAFVAGICGRNESKTKALAAKYKCRYYEDINELLQDPRINIVTIATPSGAHLDSCIAAAEAGKHIICEKPLEISEDRIKRIIEVCNQHKVVLSGIFNRRFNPAVDALKDAIVEGRFGTLALCSAYIKWYRDQAYYDNGIWRGTKGLDGGGALMNQSIHTIDLLQYLAGPVKSLSGNIGCLTHENIEVEDNAVAILQFENGAKGVIEASTSSWSSVGHPAEIHICGSEGSVFLKDDKFSVWDFKTHSPKDEMIQNTLMDDGNGGIGANDPNSINAQGHIQNFKNVIDAIIENTIPLISGEEAMKSVKIINAIYESDSTKSWIEL